MDKKEKKKLDACDWNSTTKRDQPWYKAVTLHFVIHTNTLAHHYVTETTP